MPNELMHHGILGMKWGIRRYQNKDGTLTPEGKKRYSSKTAINDIENGAANYKSYADKVEAVTKDCLPFSANYSYIVDRARSDPEVKNRVNEAARLGLKVFKDDSSQFGNSEFVKGLDFSDFRDWFLFEDQTFGMGLVCDLINQGYTADQCKKLIDIVADNGKGSYYDLPDDTLASYAAFDIQEGSPSHLKAWADDVYKHKNK